MNGALVRILARFAESNANVDAGSDEDNHENSDRVIFSAGTSASTATFSTTNGGGKGKVVESVVSAHHLPISTDVKEHEHATVMSVTSVANDAFIVMPNSHVTQAVTAKIPEQYQRQQQAPPSSQLSISMSAQIL
ncbi:unnamed protein product [Ceratitis capitata]|uniref:(Mediterranean fruit fly) hypothetical protein n=1 Tax=Ceratitis capitata TaxID=7213 RepID=A0A811VDD7_CERCA|nr:unnamed protein product [Ceratitis capitata]